MIDINEIKQMSKQSYEKKHSELISQCKEQIIKNAELGMFSLEFKVPQKMYLRFECYLRLLGFGIDYLHDTLDGITCIRISWFNSIKLINENSDDDEESNDNGWTGNDQRKYDDDKRDRLNMSVYQMHESHHPVND